VRAIRFGHGRGGDTEPVLAESAQRSADVALGDVLVKGRFGLPVATSPLQSLKV
jgi:hypothetical protein